MSVAAIVPAAGAGARMGGASGKLFAPLGGLPLLAHTLQAIQRSRSVRWIVVAARPEEQAALRARLRRWRITKAIPPCLGGASRAESVARAFAALPAGARWVLVHDGARPCVTTVLIERSVRAARRFGAVACGLPATLTVKAADPSGAVRLTLDRDTLWFAQTPQVFRRDWFAEALERADGALARFPDDAALLESAGFTVRMIPGDPENIKITRRDDLRVAEVLLRGRRSVRN